MNDATDPDLRPITDADIRPCPFCWARGHMTEAVDGSFYQVMCGVARCNARGPERPVRAEAIMLWNTRIVDWDRNA